MPEKVKKKKIRETVDLSEQDYATLSTVVDTLNLHSNANAFRLSLRLLHYFSSQDADKKFGFIDKDGVFREIVFVELLRGPF